MQPCASSSKMIVASSRVSARAADVVLHIDAAEAERRRLAQRLDREDFVLVPFARLRHHLVAGELPRGGLEGALVLGELEIHHSTDRKAPARVNGGGASRPHAGRVKGIRR